MKLPLTLNFKILSVETLVFIYIYELFYPHKIICMLAAPPVSPDDVISRLIWLFLFRLNEGFSGHIEGNPMLFLQYDAINSTFM